MTPTEQNKELRELVHIVQNADTTYDAMQFITADRKRVVLEARLDEVYNFGNWNSDRGITELWAVIDKRIAELKAQQEDK